MKWLWILLGALVVLVAIVHVTGLCVAREHRATCRARFIQPAEALFTALTDVEGLAAWRTGLQSAVRIDPIGGKPAYRESTSHGTCTYVVETQDAPRTLVLRIADDTLPYGGTWTFALTPEAGATTLAITEDGVVKPAIFRALARFVFGYHATMEQYLKSLGRKFGADVRVERVPAD